MSDNTSQINFQEKLIYHNNAKYDTKYLAWPYLGLVVIALIGIVIWELGQITVADETYASLASPTLPIVARAPAVSSMDSSSGRLERTLARPLFSQNRRRPAHTAAAVADAPKSRPRLTGVIVSSIGGSAIFAGVEGGKSIVVGEGDRIGTATVETIEAGQVILRGPDGTFVLRPVSSDLSLQVGQSSIADLAMPGYRTRPDGHYAAFWKTAAAAAQPRSNR